MKDKIIVFAFIIAILCLAGLASVFYYEIYTSKLDQTDKVVCYLLLTASISTFIGKILMDSKD